MTVRRCRPGRGSMQARNRRRRKTRRKVNRTGVRVITFVVIVLFAALLIEGVKLRTEIIANDEEQQTLMRQIAEEEERSQTADEARAYLHSEEYIKQAAHEKLGLVEENEIIFKEKD